MELNYTIKPEYKAISEIKNYFIENLTNEGFSFSYDIEMGFTELMENSIKYSEDAKDFNDISIHILLQDRKLSITLSNFFKSDDDINSLMSIVDRIKEYGSKRNLYLDRINEIINQDGIGKSQLGLYRIAYEGDFSISYNLVNDKKITITIEKQI